MKRILLSALLLISGGVFAQPVCTPDTSVCTPTKDPKNAVCSDVSVLGDMIAGQSYSQVVKFVVSKIVAVPALGDQPIKSIKVLSVNNLPSGMQYWIVSYNSASNPPGGGQVTLTPKPGSQYGPVGCVTLYGTVPHGVKADATDSITLKVAVQATVSSGISQTDTAFFRVKYIDPAAVRADKPISLTDLKLYPNPAVANAAAGFTLRKAATVRLSVLDLSGREVLSLAPQRLNPGPQSLEVSCGDLPSGLYLVRLEADGQVSTARLAR